MVPVSLIVMASVATSPMRVGYAGGDDEVELANGCQGQENQPNFIQAEGGKKATLSTEGDDIINGTPGNDKIKGLGGNDLICGVDGNDKIDGGDGDDTLEGGDGNDKLKGRDGSDRIGGGHDPENPDELEADSGVDADKLNGGLGNDAIIGGSGSDKVEGSTGNDLVVGGAHTDKINDGKGTDGCEATGIDSPAGTADPGELLVSDDKLKKCETTEDDAADEGIMNTYDSGTGTGAPGSGGRPGRPARRVR